MSNMLMLYNVLGWNYDLYVLFPQTGSTPLLLAAEGNQVTVVEVLLSARADVNLVLNVSFKLVRYV